jgi:hypothetical protein
MYCKIYINYRSARQIAWLMFQTLLRRSALAAVFSSAVWIRDKAVRKVGERLGGKYEQKTAASSLSAFYQHPP